MKVYDNIYSDEDNQKIFDYLLAQPYFYGERDNPEQLPTGVITNINDNNFYSMLLSVIKQHVPDIDQFGLQRVYVNLFQPNEQPNFHKDGNVTTCLIYVMPEELHIDEGGETQFYVGGDIMGILPKPCRMVVFDGNLLHRATSFRSYPRFTIAVKFFRGE